ncbi:hypothetical protein EV1_031664 [Malus domestica]
MRVDRGKRGRSSLYRGFRLGVSNLVLLTLPRLSSWLISWLIGRRIMIERALGAKGGEFSSSGKFWVSEKGVAQCIIAGFGVFEGKGQSFLLLWWLWFLERWRNHLGFGAISLECACWDWLKCPGDKGFLKGRLNNDEKSLCLGDFHESPLTVIYNCSVTRRLPLLRLQLSVVSFISVCNSWKGPEGRLVLLQPWRARARAPHSRVGPRRPTGFQVSGPRASYLWWSCSKDEEELELRDQVRAREEITSEGWTTVASRKSRSTSKGRSGARRDVGRNRFGESSNGKGKAAVEEEDEFMEAGEENLELLQIGGSRKRVRNSGNENGSGFVVEDVD